MCLSGERIEFQSRNRESCLFKSYRECDNWAPGKRFQSRNRESCLFKWDPAGKRTDLSQPWKFQSRNRESCLFKLSVESFLQRFVDDSFNLVIENLVFSSQIQEPQQLFIWMFQSRNRESCLFKWKRKAIPQWKTVAFQSRNRESCLFKFVNDYCLFGEDHKGFNLVIENLVFSSQIGIVYISLLCFEFQSRNRESCLFKDRWNESWYLWTWIVSIS